MDNLDFRKWLTEYGYTYKEYEALEEEKKKEIESRFKAENKGSKIQSAGETIKGIGCLIILIPLLLILLFFIWGVIVS